VLEADSTKDPMGEFEKLLVKDMLIETKTKGKSEFPIFCNSFDMCIHLFFLLCCLFIYIYMFFPVYCLVI
jgi:hypothetical protein